MILCPMRTTASTARLISSSVLPPSLCNSPCSFQSGLSARITLHELRRWCTHSSRALRSFIMPACFTPCISFSVAWVSVSSISSLLPYASRGDKSGEYSCSFIPIHFSDICSRSGNENGLKRQPENRSQAGSVHHNCPRP